MSTYADRRASEVMACEHPSVTQHHAKAGYHARQRFAQEHAHAWHREQEGRSILAAVLAWARLEGRCLIPAEALRIAARIAERAAAVTDIRIGETA